MAFDFPSSPTDAQIFNPLPGLKYRYSTALGLWETVPYAGTAAPFNFVVNPDFSISQEYGTTALSVGVPADMWTCNQNVLNGYVNMIRVVSPTPNGSPLRMRFNVVTGKALAAADWSTIDHRIEGTRFAPFKWGSAYAEQAVLRFGIRASVAGNYSLAVRNYAATRTFTALMNVPVANTDYEQTVVIPGCTDGVWIIDTSNYGVILYFGLAVGTTYRSSANNTWLVTTSTHGAFGSDNGAATAGTTLEIFDIGLYLDPDKTGVAPKWEAPSEMQNMTDCLRYWYPLRSARGASNSATLGGRLAAPHPVMMRANPAIAVGTVGGNVCYMWDYGGSGTITGLSNYANTYHIEFNGNTAGTLGAGRTCLMLPEYPGYISVNARM